MHDTRPAGIHPPSPPKELLPAAESEKGWAEYFMGHKVALHGRGRWVLVLDEEVVDATLTSRVPRVAPSRYSARSPPWTDSIKPLFCRSRTSSGSIYPTSGRPTRRRAQLPPLAGGARARSSFYEGRPRPAFWRGLIPPGKGCVGFCRAKVVRDNSASQPK